MKQYIANALVPLFLLALIYDAGAQCTCIGGAAVGGSMPAGVEGAIGVLQQDQFRTSMQYRFSNGDTYFRGARKAETGPVAQYRTQYLGIVAGYGVTNDFTVESELGYYIEKYQDFLYYAASGSGPSHISVSGKYNVYKSPDRDVEATLGAGGRAPLEIGESNLPQHVLPSTGAYGAFLQGLLQQRFSESDVRLALSHRSDFSAENRLGYTYGPGFFTSLYTIWNPAESVTALVEIRNEFRMKDAYYGSMLDDSGSNIFIISPQAGYAIGAFYFSALADIPIYRYYNGYQLANDVSFAVNLSWQMQAHGD